MPSARPGNANEFIEQQLDDRIRAISDHFQSHALSFHGPLYVGVDNLFRESVEKLRDEQEDSDRLIVIVTTGGGFIEVVHRIVDTLRTHYSLVEFVVPNSAYSAGTVLVMSGDAIHMDYYSRLGPIDPQVETRDGKTVPALGYLERYESLIQKAQKGTISLAETQLLIDGFDQAELHQYEQARELSVTLLKEWLVKYKFKNWKITRTRKKRVTKAMRTQRAETIAKELNKTTRWHSHGHGISKDVLENDLGLLIDDFGGDANLRKIIPDYYDLLEDYMTKLGTRGAIHTHGSFRPFM